jgi:hypothetical protein
MRLIDRYTGKDQVRPLNAVKKQRNCHIKFAAYDDQVLILGNGNQGEYPCHSSRSLLMEQILKVGSILKKSTL